MAFGGLKPKNTAIVSNFQVYTYYIYIYDISLYIYLFYISCLKKIDIYIYIYSVVFATYVPQSRSRKIGNLKVWALSVAGHSFGPLLILELRTLE